MSYRVIKRVPYHGNSERCKVLRMFYAKEMLTHLQNKVRCINIDESWIPHLDFRSKMWRQRGVNNTHSVKSITFKVNMIVAVDTEGNVYSSLTQFNTDSSVMLMFLSRLAQQLTKETPDWRENTIFIFDNASYHK